MASTDGDDCEVMDSRVEGEIVYCDREDFQRNQYMLVGFGSSKDPYFEDLNVEIPDDELSNDGDFSDTENSTPNGQDDSIIDGTNVDSDILDEIFDSEDALTSPETGESEITLATAIVLFALSALSITALKRRDMHLNK